jgi:hypothetical protein
MHGKRDTAKIPTYGNKVLAVRHATLDIHGAELTETWTEISETASVDDTSITIDHATDWVIGDVIVIAGTGFANNETEERTITDITNSGMTLEFLEPL